MSPSRYISIILSALLLNCQEPLETRVPETAKDIHLVQAKPGDNISKETLQLLASSFGQTQLSSLLQYDVEAYIITYNTKYKGQPIEASGLLMVPTGVETAAAIVSLQHGTEFRKADAPTLKGGLQGLEFFASAGYVTVMPDFLGYGASDSILHPYYDREYAAASVIDLIKAGKEFLRKEDRSVENKLFLAGYSEGGYVTLAAAQEIEENPAHDLQVAAVAAGAGGYDLPHMLSSITAARTYAYPAYLAFVLMSYNETYEWNKPLSYFFDDRYAAVLETALDGSKGGGYINSRLTTHVPSLLDSGFFARLRKPSGETQLKSALRSNSVAGWKTDVPIRLFHGVRDEIIPYQNSQVTLEKFKAAGSENVSLTLIPAGTHGNSFEPMLRNFIPWFLSM